MAKITITPQTTKTISVSGDGTSYTATSSGTSFTLNTTGVQYREQTTVVATDFNDTYQGEWVSDTEYSQGDIVRYEERLYVAKLAITSSTDPQADTTYWTEVVDPRGSISVSNISGDGSVAYNAETGVVSYTGPTDADYQGAFTAGAGISITDGTVSSTITQYTDTNAQNAITVVDAGGDGSLTKTGGTITYTGPTDAEVRAHFSAGSGISITDGSIASTITQYTDTDARGAISGGTGITYNNITGVITNDITQYTDADARGSISGGNGISYNSTTGVVAVDSTIATETYVDTAISNLVDTAPTTLDTLNELAAALNDDPNFSTTITNQIANKLNTSDFTSTADTWLATKDTDDVAEGLTNKYYSSTLFNTDLATKTTDNLTEGATNLYYLDSRARGSISAGTGISYNNTTGVVSSTITQYTDSDARSSVSAVDAGGDGSFAYNSATGAFTYTGPSASEVRAHFTAGTGISITDGEIATSITQYTDEQAQDTVASMLTEGNNITLTYDDAANTLTIDATQATQVSEVVFTAINKEGSALDKGTPVYAKTGTTSGQTVEVGAADASDSSKMPAIGVLNEDLAIDGEGELLLYGHIQGVDTQTPGFSVGDVIYVAAGGGFTNTPPAGESNIIQNLGIVSKVHLTNGGGLVEGAGRGAATPNLNDGKIFIGNASNQSSTATLNTTIVPEGTNLYYTTARHNTDFDTRLATKTTDNLTEGTTNKYYSTTLFNTDLATKDTDDLAEGLTNKYFSNTLARGAVSAVDNGGDGAFTYDSSTGAFTYTGPSAAEVRAHISAGAGINYNNTTGVVSSTITQYTDEMAQDTVAGMLTDGAGISSTYNDVANTYTIASTITQYTDADARSALSGGTGITYTSATGSIAVDTSTIATQSYVDTAVSNLVDTAPDALNTLNELAAALGDDANFSTTITNSIATKAELTDLSVSTAAASGNGSLAYNNTTGVFTFTPADVPATLTDLGITDGTSGQVLTTNGAGTFTFTTVASGGGDLVDDTTPQLGGTLDTNGYDIVPPTTQTLTIGDSTQTNQGFMTLYSTGAVRLDTGGTADLQLLAGDDVLIQPDDDLRLNPLGGITWLGGSSMRGTGNANFAFVADTGYNLLLGADGNATGSNNAPYIELDDQAATKQIQMGGMDNIQLVGNTSSVQVSINAGTTTGVLKLQDLGGELQISGIKYPKTDGVNGQVLTTDGAGQLSWTTAGGGGIAEVVEDTTPTLGGDLELADNIITNSTGTETLRLSRPTNQGIHLESDVVVVSTAATIGGTAAYITTRDLYHNTNSTATADIIIGPDKTTQNYIRIYDGTTSAADVFIRSQGEVRIDALQGTIDLNGNQTQTNIEIGSGANIIYNEAADELRFLADTSMRLETNQVMLQEQSFFPGALITADLGNNLYLSSDGGEWNATTLTPDEPYVMIDAGSNITDIHMDYLYVGDGASDATITTNGAYDLTLRTNGTASGPNIRIYDGSSGHIYINGAGSGNIYLNPSNGNTSVRRMYVETYYIQQGYGWPSSPVAGMIVFNGSDNKHYGYNGSSWNAFY